MPGPEEYESDDIYLAAYLLLAGCDMARKRKAGTKIWFVFTNAGGPIKDLRDAFYSGKALVKAHDYSLKIVAMKQLCFE